MPRIFGVEAKPWMLWVGGGGAILLILLYLRSRGGGAPAAESAPGDMFGAGAVTPSAPASVSGSPAEEVAKRSAFEQQLQDLMLQSGQSRLKQQERMFELQYGEEQQRIAVEGRYGQAAAGVYEAAAGLQTVAFARQAEAAKKAGVKCPPGEHPINQPGVGLICAPLGTSRTSGRALRQRAVGVAADIGEAYVKSQFPTPRSTQAGTRTYPQQQATSGDLYSLIPWSV